MSRVARDAGTVAVVTAVARVVGFVRWLVFAWAVGATGVGTVYQSVNTVPNIVYEIAAGGVLALRTLRHERAAGPAVASAVAASSVGSTGACVMRELLRWADLPRSCRARNEN